MTMAASAGAQAADPAVSDTAFSPDFAPPGHEAGHNQIPEPIGAAAFAIALGLLVFFRLHHPKR
jgi:hypothetical protein